MILLMEPAPAFDDPRDIKGYGLLYSPTQQAAGLDAPRDIKGYGLMYSPTQQAAGLDAPRDIKGYGLLYGGRRPLGAGFDRRRCYI